MLAAGAFVGLVVALAGVTFVEAKVNGEVRHLARFAFLLPPGIFVLWWLFFPGFSVDRGEVSAEEAAAAVDATRIDERIARIISTFDDSAVPRPTRAPQPEDPTARDTLLRSVRRNPDLLPLEDANAYGLRRRVVAEPRVEEA
jgi:hypothetical protein